jgi:hypothetical protein
MIDLSQLAPYDGPGVEPKGLVPYEPGTRTGPKNKSLPTIKRILALYEEMAAADALPMGPRQCAYRLKERFPGEYVKMNARPDQKDFNAIGMIVRRLQQAGKIRWPWVADASGRTFEANGSTDVDGFLRSAHRRLHLDRRTGQPVVVEITTEARETLPLVHRLGQERGVSVYSGGGGSGPRFAYDVAVRALRRAVEHHQSTVILGIGDFDQPGIKNIMRPHVEHVAAFLFGTSGNEEVLGWQDGAVADTGASVEFEHLAITPAQALDVIELAGSPEDRDAIERYTASGADLWSRDLGELAGVQKIELEVFDPADLRTMVIDAIEEVIDLDVLEDRQGQEQADRERLESEFAELADRWDTDEGDEEE